MAYESIHTQFGMYLQTLGPLLSIVATDESGAPAIYYARGKQDSSADPYLVYRCLSYMEEQEVGGPPVVATADFQVSCFSQSPDAAQLLASIVRSLLRFAALPYTLGPFTILGNWIKESPDQEEGGVLVEYGLFETVVHVGMQFVLP